VGGVNVIDLLNYGVGTTIALVLTFFVIRIMNKLVNDQSRMIGQVSSTLKDIAGTMLVIQDNIKDLQLGQEKLWQEIRHLQRRDKK
jgi:uncharacterized protein YoxC